MVPAADRDTRIAANLEWLISVRWAALGAQALSVAAAYLFVGSPPTYSLVAAVLVLGIRHELARCGSTLDRLSTDAGQSPDEALTPTRAGDVVAAVSYS